jgi:hypothetical protein
MVALKTIIGAAGLASLAMAVASPAGAADLFHIYKQDQTKHVIYESPRDVKLCVKGDEGVTSISVVYKNGSEIVKPGSCASFTATEFQVTPHEAVPFGWAMVADGTTVKPRDVVVVK